MNKQIYKKGEEWFDALTPGDKAKARTASGLDLLIVKHFFDVPSAFLRGALAARCRHFAGDPTWRP